MTLYQTQPAETTVLAFPPLLSDEELASILVMTIEWVRSHSSDIPGFERLGTYFRFRRLVVERWLGSLDRLLEAEQVAVFLKVPKSWVYANANHLPGLLQLGRYVRFRPQVIKQFLAGSEVAQ